MAVDEYGGGRSDPDSEDSDDVEFGGAYTETKLTANREKGTVMIARLRRRCRVRVKNAHKWTSATTRVPIGSRWRPPGSSREHARLTPPMRGGRQRKAEGQATNAAAGDSRERRRLRLWESSEQPKVAPGDEAAMPAVEDSTG